MQHYTNLSDGTFHMHLITKADMLEFAADWGGPGDPLITAVMVWLMTYQPRPLGVLAAGAITQRVAPKKGRSRDVWELFKYSMRNKLQAPRPQCSNCERPFSGKAAPEAFVVAESAVDSNDRRVAGVFCSQCFTSAPDAMQIWLQRTRKDYSEVEVVHVADEGHA
jgi:hypothetical protein